MQFINRAVAIIKPKQPFLDWVNSTDPDTKLTLEQVRSDPLCILIPDFDSPSEAKAFIKSNYAEIWEWQLYAYWTDGTTYPKHRPFEKFKDWFDVEFCSEVIDWLDEAIETEEV
jgi:hypothetical protein